MCSKEVYFIKNYVCVCKHIYHEIALALTKVMFSKRHVNLLCSTLF
jgi:hypothetical protein